MNKPAFTYNDVVRVLDKSGLHNRGGARAWIIAVFAIRPDRPGPAFDSFPDGPVYTIEFEDGRTAEVHETWLEREE